MNHKKHIKLGVERLLEDTPASLRGARVGLICNQASIDHSLRHVADRFVAESDFQLTTFFGPQHGIRGEVQDNMIETPHTEDSVTGLPVYSLYSETRIPSDEMLAEVDTLVFDMQDVGCRIYTFVYTLANCMRAAGKLGKRVIVCDRPNPIGGVAVAGNVLEPEFASFVGQFPVPVRHGMTVGELAKLYREHFGIECELEVITMGGWNREDWFDETDAPWVMPSPNIPTPDTCTVFPATVLLEGTQVSEGRGCTRPFEVIGAPYINPQGFAEKLNGLGLAGVYFRPNSFQPTFQKHAGKNCGGVQIHVLDRNAFDSAKCGVAIVQVAYEMYKDDFRWKDPPYEYEYDRNPFDIITGTGKLRAQIESGIELDAIEHAWIPKLEEFKALRREFLLY